MYGMRMEFCDLQARILQRSFEKIIFRKRFSALVISAVGIKSYLGEAPKTCNKLRL